MAVMHDFRCTVCQHVEEHFAPSNMQHAQCTACGETAEKVFLTSAKLDWLGLAQGDNASPEAISKFKRMHRQQKAKEEKSLREHGDYGAQPGGRGLTYEQPITPRDGTTLPSE